MLWVSIHQRHDKGTSERHTEALEKAYGLDIDPMTSSYTFNTELTGFVAVERDQGKFNNRSFGFQIPQETLEQIHSDRVDLLMWAKNKTKAKKPWEIITPWDDKGVVKYSYGAGDGSRKPKPEPVFTDVNGEILIQDQLSLIKNGSKVCLTVEQRPYVFEDNSGRHLKAQVGTSLRVTEVKALEVGRRSSKTATLAGSVDNSPLLFHRSLADLIGSGVVYALQDILDHYIPVVGNENRNALIELVRQEAHEYLDQERMESPSKSSLRAHVQSLEV